MISSGFTLFPIGGFGEIKMTGIIERKIIAPDPIGTIEGMHDSNPH